MNTGNAVVREAEWLRTSGDGLPALLTEDGGPWDIVQAYIPRTAYSRQSQIYVVRHGFGTRRRSNQRRIPSYQFNLVCLWPIGQTTVGANIGEDEQQAFDDALDLLVKRIEGFVGDKSHGGRFLAVVEAPDPARLTVTFTDPAQTMASAAFLAAQVTYDADDTDYVM